MKFDNKMIEQSFPKFEYYINDMAASLRKIASCAERTERILIFVEADVKRKAELNEKRRKMAAKKRKQR